VSYPIKSPRKLIEVALPLDAINAEASLRKRKAPAGYPTALHKWWAQRPLAAARAVIFAQLVNDPGYQQGGGFRYGRNKKEAAIERQRLFKIIEELVLWENTSNEDVLERARTEIRRSWAEVCDLNKDHPQAAELFVAARLPAFHDPFAGSGAIPLEAQRLGLHAYASDLNPVAVLIDKAMIEIPARFARRAPVGPPVEGDGRAASLALHQSWPRADGLAEDVRRYGAWVQREAQRRVGHLFPAVEILPEMAIDRPDLRPLVGKKLTVVAWLWARTVKSPSPVFAQVDVPLASTFMLSNKAGKEVYVEPLIDGQGYSFRVKVGPPRDAEAAKRGTTASKWNAFRCLMSDVPISYDYIRGEGTGGRMGCRLMAVVAEGVRGRVYLSPSPEMEAVGREAPATWSPDLDINYHPRDIKTQIYGLTKYGHLFTQRQLAVLTTFSDLILEAREKIRRDVLERGLPDSPAERALEGVATGYADAVSVYLAFAVSRAADYGCSIATWRPKDSAMRSAMAKQALPMTWDFAEGNLFGPSSSGFSECVEVIARVISAALAPSSRAPPGQAVQRNAADTDSAPLVESAIISTDPPYYDNIGYADLSDFFYVWLRRSLRAVYPTLFATLAVPKAEELVATPYRHDGKEAAEAFFLDGMTRAMSHLARQAHEACPITIYYAFKQSETKTAGTSSTGWDTFLAAVIRAGLSITGTWPVRTEGDNRQMGVGNNALASSIVLVCRKRAPDAPTISRREFLRELNAVLPAALDEMTKGSGDDRSPVAPVDLSQAIIGPGMGVFSKYGAVLEADGEPMSVRTALQLINRFLAEDDFEPDTRFCLHWFEQNGWKDGRFGEADTLSRASGTSVDGVKQAGVVASGGGIVRLLKWSEYPADWDPKADTRNPVWETLHHLIRALKRDGETGAGRLLAAVIGQAESVRQLAYRLYTLCERQGWAEDARAYNELITSWTGIEAAVGAAPTAKQGSLF
jgi:putative DNA methylase